MLLSSGARGVLSGRRSALAYRNSYEPLRSSSHRLVCFGCAMDLLISNAELYQLSPEIAAVKLGADLIWTLDLIRVVDFWFSGVLYVCVKK